MSPGDKIYCVYIGPNEEMVREHARAGRLSAPTAVSEVTSIIDPRHRRGVML